MDDVCPRCGGELSQGPILSNYKSYVVSLARCGQCGATVQRTENAHRPGASPTRAGRQPLQPNRYDPSQPKPRHVPARRDVAPEVSPAPPAPAPRSAPAKRLVRPFNVRVTYRRREN